MDGRARIGNAVSVCSEKARYGIITDEILDEIFNTRLLAASLLARADPDTAFMASMVHSTLASIRKELEGLL